MCTDDSEHSRWFYCLHRSWGHGNTCGRDEASLSSTGRICDQTACLSLPYGDPNATEVQPNRWCCGAGPVCTEGYSLFDEEGTPGAELCYQTLYKICCVEDGPAPPPPPPLSHDEEIVHLHRCSSGGGVCSFNLESGDALHGAQGNNFLRNGGAMPRLFREEYFRFFQEMMAKPEYLPCAVADAAAVLLDADSGVIRAAYDEDRAFWHRAGDAEDEIDFIGAWARLRIASVNAAIDGVVAGFNSSSSSSSTDGPASCGTATSEAIGALCASAGIDGVCDQGSLSPRCVLPAEAGYDQCGCPPGYGWNSGQCKVGSSSSSAEAAMCLTGTAGTNTLPTDGGSSSVVSTIIVLLLVVLAASVAVAEAKGKLRPKKVGESGIQEDFAGVGGVEDNPAVPQLN